MTHLHYILCLVILLLGTSSVFAQNYQLHTQYFSSEDGLSNNFVRQIYQDKEGTMWLSTMNGLNHFNGYSFKNFNKEQNNLASNNIYFTYEDVQGNLWVHHFDKTLHDGQLEKMIDILDPITEQTLPFDTYFEHKDCPIKVKDIAVYQADDEHNIWILTNQNQIFRFDSVFTPITTLPDEFLSQAVSLTVEMDTLWISCKTGIWKVVSGSPPIKVETWEYNHYNNIFYSNGSHSKWRYFKSFNEEKITFLFKPIHQNWQPFHPKPYADDKIEWIINDHQNNFWYWSKSGKMTVVSSDGEVLVEQILDDLGDDNSFHATTFLFDHQDNLWIGTTTGFYIITLQKTLFKNYLSAKGTIDVRGITQDKEGNLYINERDLYQIKEDKHKVLLKDGATALYYDAKQDVLYSGTYAPLIFQYNLNTQTSRAIELSPNYPKSSTGRVAKYIYRSQKTGRLWLGMETGLALLDSAAQYIEPFQEYNEFTSLKNAIVNFIYENQEGLWLATTNGLYFVDEELGVLAHYATIFPHLDIAYIHEDESGAFWLASRGGGLLHWNRINNEVQQFSTAEGLSHQVIYAVYEDDYGFLWLPSNYGLMRFDKNAHTVKTFLPSDGIPHEEFNTISHYQAADGTLFFGGLGGVTSFHPRDFLEASTERIPLLISEFKKLNANTGALEDFTSAIKKIPSITLSPEERGFLIEFTLLNYADLKGNQYAWKIEGLEEKWNYISENYVRINALPYGKYTLLIKARDANGHWVAQQLTIPIYVLKPVYLQNWFLLLCVGIIIIATIGMWRWRTYRLRNEKLHLEQEVARRTATIEQQKQELQQLDQLKNTFFTNVAHELRTPLTLISMPIERLLQDNNFNEQVSSTLCTIRNNSQKLMHLVEEIIDISHFDQSTPPIQEEPILIYPFISQIFDSYQSYADFHGLEYQLDYQAAEDLYLVLDAQKFQKIIDNFLSNAFKFTPSGGKILLSVRSCQENYLKISVSDSGQGIHSKDLPHIFERYYQSKENNAPIQGGMGIGLSIVKEYATLINGKISVESQPNVGSTFTLLLRQQKDLKIVATQNSKKHSETHRRFIEQPIDDRKSSLLLVEDNIDLQLELSQSLSRDYNIYRAPNGKKALTYLEQYKINLIITDLMMPEMDGIALIEQIKAHKTWQHLPIIVLTAKATITDKLDMLRIGVDDYLYKPFNLEELQVRIFYLLKNQKNKVTLFSNEAFDHSEMDSDVDQTWLKEVEVKTIELLHKNPKFRLADLASELHLSERHLRRRLQEVISLTPSEYIREIKLHEGKSLLLAKNYKTVAEIAHVVGFSDEKYFTKIFTKRFGKTPAEVVADLMV